MLPQLFVNGLIAGSIYALVALGFGLIYYFYHSFFPLRSWRRLCGRLIEVGAGGKNFPPTARLQYSIRRLYP